MQNKFLDIILGICIVLIIAILIIGPKNIKFDNEIFGNIFSAEKIIQNINEQTNNNKVNEEQQQNNEHQNKIVKITLYKELPLSYQTKEYILNLRKQYVAKSIFASENYNPSEEVFGQIEDNKPWLSAYRKKYGNQCKTDGPSAHSKEIINPSVLVHIDWPYYWSDLPDNSRTYSFSLVPAYAEYNKETNEITVYYSSLPITTVNPYILNGVNARDLGYKYAYVDEKKSKNLPNFPNNPNIANSISEFRDFIHVGGSCGVEGGCNNLSPWQPNLAFSYYSQDYYNLNEIYIKLWKNMPSSVDEPADIAERIVLLIPPRARA